MRHAGALLATLVAALALAVPSLAEAQHVAKGKRQQPSAEADGNKTTNDGASTMPADDAIREPTAEEMAALSAAVKALVNDDATGLTAEQKPDGSVRVDLQDRFQNVAVAVRRDGKVEERCITSSEEANNLAKPSVTPAARRPTPLEEK